MEPKDLEMGDLVTYQGYRCCVAKSLSQKSQVAPDASYVSLEFIDIPSGINTWEGKDHPGYHHEDYNPAYTGLFLNISSEDPELVILSRPSKETEKEVYLFP